MSEKKKPKPKKKSQSAPQGEPSKAPASEKPADVKSKPAPSKSEAKPSEPHESKSPLDMGDLAAALPVTPTRCAICPPDSSTPAELRCAGCHVQKYCGKEHQKDHWKSHKRLCKPLGEWAAASRTIPRNFYQESPPRVFILGGGVIGCSIAYYLSLRGIQPTIVERASIACAASGKAGGFLAQTWCDKGPRRELMRRSWDCHMQLAKKLNGAASYGFRMVDTLGLFMPEPGVPLSAEQRRRLVPLSSSNNSNAPRWAKWISGPLYSAHTMGSKEPNRDYVPPSAQVQPKMFTETMLKHAKDRGTKVLIGVVEDVKTVAGGGGGRKVTAVVVNGVSHPCDIVVVAMGPWSGQAQKWFGLSYPKSYGQKCHSISMQPSRPLHVTDTCLFVDWETKDNEPKVNIHPTYEFYPRTHIEPDREVYLHGMDEAWRIPEEIDPLDVVPTPGATKRLREVAGYVCSTMGEGKFLAENACYMPLVPDGEPLMGRVPNVLGAYVAAGHAEWGITLAPGVGVAMSELILDGASSMDLRAFAAERFPVGFELPQGKRLIFSKQRPGQDGAAEEEEE